MINILPVICLMGPTAVGKTQLAITLAETLPCDIISVDSAMVYRGMDIGTAKPPPGMLAQVPHRLIDIRGPANYYSAGDFVRDAQAEIRNSLQQNRIPLLVGGTMLYFRVLQNGMAELPSKLTQQRQQFYQALNNTPLSSLHQALAQYDPVAAQRIHPKDTQRIQRAMAVYTHSEQPLTHLQQRHEQPAPYHFINLAILPEDRAQLRLKIAARFHHMLGQGFIEEVERLHQREDLHRDFPASRAVGYRQILAYLAGAMDYQTMIERSIIASCQLAKKQLTWLRSWPNLQSFSAEDSLLLDKIVHALQQRLGSDLPAK